MKCYLQSIRILWLAVCVTGLLTRPLLASQEAVQNAPTETSTCTVVRPRLTIVWIDPENALPATERLESELLSLLESMGIEGVWVPYVGRKTPGGGAELHVHLRTTEPARIGVGPGTLGIVYGGKEPDHRVFVYIRALIRVLGLKPSSVLAEMKVRPRRDIARALSRVIVHEIFHAIAPEAPHGAEGLTQRALTRRDLLRDDPVLERSAVELLVRELQELRARSEADARDCTVGRKSWKPRLE